MTLNDRIQDGKEHHELKREQRKMDAKGAKTDVERSVFGILKKWYDAEKDAYDAIEAMIDVTDIYIKAGWDFK